MRGEKYRLPLFLQALQDIPHLAPGAGVEPGRRFVEEHDLGVVHQRNRDSEALLQAPGEVLVLLPGLVLEVHEADQPVNIGFPAAKEPRVVLEGLPDRYPVERAEPLRKDADAGDDVALLLRNVHPEQAHVARRGRADGLDNLDGRGLAGAVRAQEGEHFTFPDRERYAVNRQQPAVAFRQMLDFDYMFSFVRHVFLSALARHIQGGGPEPDVAENLFAHRRRGDQKAVNHGLAVFEQNIHRN